MADVSEKVETAQVINAAETQKKKIIKIAVVVVILVVAFWLVKKFILKK